jgi:aminoglycoside 3-N-acetyltransferase
MNVLAENGSYKEKIIKELALSWNESGLVSGDTVLIHSSVSGILKRFKEKEIILSPEDILESFIAAAGKEGTLIFPTFNFDFTKGKTFDIRNTKSETGALTEAARLNRNFIRTGHPLFSFAVTGYHRDKFQNLYNYSAFGNDSPLSILHKLDGKIAALDIAGENCMTFYHYIEEMENAPNRFHKVFKGIYIDTDGSETEREFSLFARNLEMGVETSVKPMEEKLWAEGLYTGYRPGTGTGLHVISAKTVYDKTAEIIREGKSENMLYIIRDKK